MSESEAPEAPKIEFPCAYPIKVLGYACEEFREHVLTVMARHALALIVVLWWCVTVARAAFNLSLSLSLPPVCHSWKLSLLISS